jgi:hypothetical protein
MTGVGSRLERSQPPARWFPPGGVEQVISRSARSPGESAYFRIAKVRQSGPSGVPVVRGEGAMRVASREMRK